MIKEIVTECYLWLVKIFWLFFGYRELANKVVFVCSFPENNLFVYRELKSKRPDLRFVFLCRRGCMTAMGRTGESVFPIESFFPWRIGRTVYHLATTKMVVVDNYYSFLSVLRLRKNVRCLQLWHACGAFKAFGLEDHTIAMRPNRAKQRFRQVYNRFDKIAVGSDRMEEIFELSFGLDDSHFLYSGIPRTDILFNQTAIASVKDRFKIRYGGRKVILYAPTFREKKKIEKLTIDLTKMEKELSDDYVLLLRSHPLANVKNGMSRDSHFVFDCSAENSIDELLLGTDILITDYSSIPFEFSLLGRPMIFFPYDLEQYKLVRGLMENYDKTVPGPIAHSTEEVISYIKADAFDLQRIRSFAQVWNKYSQGRSSNNVAQYICRCIQSVEKH